MHAAMQGGGRECMGLLSRDAAVERTRMKDDYSCIIFTSYIPLGHIHSVPAIKDLVRSAAPKMGVCVYPVYRLFQFTCSDFDPWQTAADNDGKFTVYATVDSTEDDLLWNSTMKSVAAWRPS